MDENFFLLFYATQGIDSIGGRVLISIQQQARVT